jgi:hypothetical protein
MKFCPLTGLSRVKTTVAGQEGFAACERKRRTCVDGSGLLRAPKLMAFGACKETGTAGFVLSSCSNAMLPRGSV